MHLRISNGQIPVINKNSTPSEVFSIFREHLTAEGRIEFELKSDTFGFKVINVINDKTVETEFIIPESFFNPKNHWPHFAFCSRHINKRAPIEVINHFEMLFFFLAERFEDTLKNNEIFTTYIRRDIKLITNFVEYVSPNAFNANLKSSNLLVLWAPYSTNTGTSLVYKNRDLPIGDLVHQRVITSPDKEAIIAMANCFNLMPGSETMLSESNKIVVSNGEAEISCAGFGFEYDNEDRIVGFSSIFPRASALPARLKTHVNGNHFGVLQPDKPLFIEDAAINPDGSFAFDENGDHIPLDNGGLDAIVVYQDIDFESYHQVGGDLEVNRRIGNQIVFMNRHKETEFDEILVKEGETYTARNGSVTLGVFDRRPIAVDNVVKIEVTKVSQNGYNNSARIDFVAYYKVGNSRITSHTGLKGVTKTMMTCGHIYSDDFEMEVDILTGVNSIKAKEDTVRLMQAAFALKYGYYIPASGDKLLSSMDEDEINAAAESIPEVTFKMVREGKEVEFKTRLYGVIQINYTEIGSHFTVVRSQKMSFNALRYISQTKDSNLAQYILDNCIDPDEKSAVIELMKCLNDKTRRFVSAEHKPVYTLSSLKNHFSEKDLILEHSSIFPLYSKLLDEDFNKGFYINLSEQRQNTLVRIPDAKTLGMFCSKQTNGEYVYPGILIEVCKIIQNALLGKPYYYRIIPSRNESNQNRVSAYGNYMASLKSMLYSSEISGQTLIQTMITPRLRGVNMKQMHDIYVPDGVVVVLNNRIYTDLHEYVYPTKNLPVEQGIIQAFKKLYAFTLRSPFLWKTQLLIKELWDVNKFDTYLKQEYGFALEDYLDVKSNLHCALIGKDVIKGSHSDIDGDLLQITVLPEEAQQMMKEFQLSNITDKMYQWDEDFLQSEYDGIKKLDWAKKYKLHYTPTYCKRPGDESYIDLITNSANAKKAVGPGTNNSWQFGMLIELYLALLNEDSDLAYRAISGKTGKEFVKIPLNDKLAQECDHVYTETNERYVINAIKHIKGGATQHQKFMLGTLGSDQTVHKEVVEAIVNEMGYSRETAMTIINIAIWADQHNLIKLTGDFLRMHNKGQTVDKNGEPIDLKDPEVSKWFNLIVDKTFVGKMIKPAFDVYNQCIGQLSIEEVDTSSENNVTEAKEIDIDFL